jgi:hypothetical protein
VSGKKIKMKRRDLAAKKTTAPAIQPRADDRPICLCGSGRLFAECHGVSSPPSLLAAPQPAPEILLSPTVTLKLDLACGQNCKEGFEGVDLPGIGAHIDAAIAALRSRSNRTAEDDKYLAHLVEARPRTKHELNLLRFPWPFEDDSVAEIETSHFVEHLPMIYVDAAGNEVPCGTPGARDLFFAFFDECYRILAPGGWMHVVVPCLRNSRAFQDPTHRRFYPAEAFFYLSKVWRAGNRLDHYNVACNFDGTVLPTVYQELSLRAQEVQQQKCQESWNVIIDWDVRLKTMKGVAMPASPPLAAVANALDAAADRLASSSAKSAKKK